MPERLLRSPPPSVATLSATLSAAPSAAPSGGGGAKERAYDVEYLPDGRLKRRRVGTKTWKVLHPDRHHGTRARRKELEGKSLAELQVPSFLPNPARCVAYVPYRLALDAVPTVR